MLSCFVWRLQFCNHLVVFFFPTGPTPLELSSKANIVFTFETGIKTNLELLFWVKPLSLLLVPLVSSVHHHRLLNNDTVAQKSQVRDSRGCEMLLRSSKGWASLMFVEGVFDVCRGCL